MCVKFFVYINRDRLQWRMAYAGAYSPCNSNGYSLL